MLTAYHAALLAIFGSARVLEKLLGMKPGPEEPLEYDDLRGLRQSADSASENGFPPARAGWPRRLAHGFGS